MDLGSPRKLGRYALYRAFASGGMAKVHLGRLLGAAGFARTVAIKRLHDQFTARGRLCVRCRSRPEWWLPDTSDAHRGRAARASRLAVAELDGGLH